MMYHQYPPSFTAAMIHGPRSIRLPSYGPVPYLMINIAHQQPGFYVHYRPDHQLKSQMDKRDFFQPPPLQGHYYANQGRMNKHLIHEDKDQSLSSAEQASIPIPYGPRKFVHRQRTSNHQAKVISSSTDQAKVKRLLKDHEKEKFTPKRAVSVDVHDAPPPCSGKGNNGICKINNSDQDPPLEIREKISFVINNLSPENINAKAKELSSTISKEEYYYLWFARYVVTKRVKLEPNFQDLYLQLIGKVNANPNFNQEILRVTYETIKRMLKSDTINSNMEERSFLNNLGSWLGKITMDHKNQEESREYNIGLKAMIMEAYEMGSMSVVIPFISKIFESIKKILPYQMDILGLLMEIYAMPNLKMNLVFAIEIIFRNLGLDMKQVSPTAFLKDKVRLAKENPDFSGKGRRTSK